MAAATAGAALAGIGTSILGNKAQKKAQKRALEAQAQTAANNTQLAFAGLDRSGQYLDPYAQSGMRAGNVLMEMLLGGPAGGGGGAAPSALAQMPAAAAGPDAQAQLDYLLHGSSNTIGPKRSKQIAKMSGTPEAKLAFAKSLLHPGERQAYDTFMYQQRPSPYAALQQPGGAMNAAGQPTSALSAFDQFRNSSDYQWRQDEAQRAVANNFGSDYESPAAQIALQDRASHIANQELGGWMDRLAAQQGLGANAANSMAGYNTAATGAVMGVGQNLADNQSNIYGAQGQGTANMYGSIAGSIADAAGQYVKSQQPAPGAYTGYGGSGYNSPIVTSYPNPAYGGGSAWGGP